MTHPLHSSIKVLFKVEKFQKSTIQNSFSSWYSLRDHNQSTFSLYTFSEIADGFFSFPQNFRGWNTLRRETFLEQNVFLYTAVLLGNFWAVIQGYNLHTHIHPAFITKVPLKSIYIFFSKPCFNITLWKYAFSKAWSLATVFWFGHIHFNYKN